MKHYCPRDRKRYKLEQLKQLCPTCTFSRCRVRDLPQVQEAVRAHEEAEKLQQINRLFEEDKENEEKERR